MATKHKYHARAAQFTRKERRVVVCIDGTWRDPEGADQLTDSPFLTDCTNVRRFYDTVLRDDDAQLVLYIPDSLPNGQSNFNGEVISGAFGDAARRQIAEAYVTLVINYRPGDKIYILGFGRSAAIARLLADLLGREGIPTWLNYSKDDRGRIVSYEFGCPFKGLGAKQQIDKVVPSLDVEMLGLWDTVGAVSVPAAVIGIPLQVTLLQDLSISKNVKHAYHAVAIDEKRDVYKPSLFNADPRVEEVWFIGVHHTVGGGYSHKALSDITLRFMIDRAHLLGLKFHTDSLEEISSNIKGVGVSSCESGSRVSGLNDRPIHVFRNNQPDPLLKPKIHKTVFERIKNKSDYRPSNVEELRRNYQIVK